MSNNNSIKNFPMATDNFIENNRIFTVCEQTKGWRERISDELEAAEQHIVQEVNDAEKSVNNNVDSAETTIVSKINSAETNIKSNSDSNKNTIISKLDSMLTSIRSWI